MNMETNGLARRSTFMGSHIRGPAWRRALLQGFSPDKRSLGVTQTAASGHMADGLDVLV